MTLPNNDFLLTMSCLQNLPISPLSSQSLSGLIQSLPKAATCEDGCSATEPSTRELFVDIYRNATVSSVTKFSNRV